MTIAADQDDSQVRDNPTYQLVERLARDKDFEVPLLPEAATQLIGMCNDEECSPKELSECIRRDQAIATHVLKLANSSMFGNGIEVVSLQQAIARLGINRIREIVLVVSCKTRVFQAPGFDQEVRLSFRKSLASALFAQEIARTRRLNVEDAFLAGLLHDIGTPALIQATSDAMQKEGLDLPREEIIHAVAQQRLNVASTIIDAWSLPQRIADVIGNHPPELAASGEVESKVLCLATQLADALCNDESLDVDSVCANAITHQLNLYQDQVAAILELREQIATVIGQAA